MQAFPASPYRVTKFLVRKKEITAYRGLVETADLRRCFAPPASLVVYAGVPTNVAVSWQHGRKQATSQRSCQYHPAKKTDTDFSSQHCQETTLAASQLPTAITAQRMRDSAL